MAVSAKADTVLVTGSSLAAEAASLLQDDGIHLEYSGAVSEHQHLCDLARELEIAGLIVRHGQIDEDVLQASANLKVVANHGAGYDNIDVDAAHGLGIPVFVAHGRNARSVAEQAMTLILALYKDLAGCERALRSGTWSVGRPLPREFSSKTLGIVGFGPTGRELAHLACPYDGRILAYDPFLDAAQLPADIELLSSVEELLAASDVVSLHLPLNDETAGFMNRQRLEQLKPGAFLINTSRGAVVDEAALVDALISGRLAGAGLDTFAIEPLQAGHPLCSLPNVVLTPHVAGVTEESLTRIGVSAAQNVLSVLRGHPENPHDRLCA